MTDQEEVVYQAAFVDGKTTSKPKQPNDMIYMRGYVSGQLSRGWPHEEDDDV